MKVKRDNGNERLKKKSKDTEKGTEETNEEG